MTLQRSQPMSVHIPETVTPEGLRVRARIMRKILDESCARHLELAADEIDRLRAELASARKALEPFAKMAELSHQGHKDSRPIIFGFDVAVAQRLTIGDLRAARAAFNPEQPK